MGSTTAFGVDGVAVTTSKIHISSCTVVVIGIAVAIEANLTWANANGPAGPCG